MDKLQNVAGTVAHISFSCLGNQMAILYCLLGQW